MRASGVDVRLRGPPLALLPQHPQNTQTNDSAQPCAMPEVTLQCPATLSSEGNIRERAKKMRKTLPMPPRSRVCKGSYVRGNTVSSSSGLGGPHPKLPKELSRPCRSHNGYHLVPSAVHSSS